MELFPQQQQAADKITEWYNGHRNNALGDNPIFRLFGYAGTGKTTTIRHIIEQLGIRSTTIFGAYTGKAAMVMRKHGLPATTIHSMIYTPVPPDKEECNKLQKQLQSATDVDEKNRLRKELKEKGKVHFELREKENSVLDNANLIVLDECSMVNDEMLEDLLSFDVPILVLGDPGQLPPIEGEGALTRVSPDFLLTEIHRQALDNPIIDFANRARQGIFIPKIKLGTSSHVIQGGMQSDEVLSFDQILCGKNATRQKLNQRLRQLKGFDDIYPVVGDKLICLKNDAEHGLFNGMLCEVVGRKELFDTSIELEIYRETDDRDEADPITVRALRAVFESYHDKDAMDNVKWWERSNTNEFDFGYAITVHKAQGSQWDKVLLWDDKFFVWDRKERKRWLYTGITRAVESVTIAS